MLNSKELKRTIVKRSFEYNIPLRYLCDESGIEYNDFMRSYINAVEVIRFKTTEEQFRKVLSILGIEVKYLFVIDKEVDMNDVSSKLKEKYNNIRRVISENTKNRIKIKNG